MGLSKTEGRFQAFDAWVDLALPYGAPVVAVLAYHDEPAPALVVCGVLLLRAVGHLEFTRRRLSSREDHNQ